MLLEEGGGLAQQQTGFFVGVEVGGRVWRNPASGWSVLMAWRARTAAGTRLTDGGVKLIRIENPGNKVYFIP
jgi:hypothetical protein